MNGLHFIYSIFYILTHGKYTYLTRFIGRLVKDNPFYFVLSSYEKLQYPMSQLMHNILMTTAEFYNLYESCSGANKCSTN